MLLVLKYKMVKDERWRTSHLRMAKQVIVCKNSFTEGYRGVLYMVDYRGKLFWVDEVQYVYTDPVNTRSLKSNNLKSTCFALLKYCTK